MKTIILSLALVAVLIASVHSQAPSPTGPIPTPTGSPTGPSPTGTILSTLTSTESPDAEETKLFECFMKFILRLLAFFGFNVPTMD